MESFPCPGCAEPMRVGLEVCPSCRRPRSSDEVDLARDGRVAYAAAKAASRRRLILSGLLLAAIMGVWLQRPRWQPKLDAWHARFSEEMKKAADPRGLTAAGSPPETPAHAVPPAADEGAVPTAPTSAVPAPVTAPVAGPVEPMPEPDPPSAAYCRIYGIVYDIETLRPVPSARVIFITPRFAGIEVNTDAKGRYVSDLFQELLDDGVRIKISAPGYKEGQLLDDSAPFRERTLESRRGTLAELGPSDLEPVRIAHPSGVRLLPLDFALVPEKPATR